MFDRRPARSASRPVRPKRALAPGVIRLKAGKAGRRVVRHQPTVGSSVTKPATQAINPVISKLSLGISFIVALVALGGVVCWQMVTRMPLDEGPYRLLLVEKVGANGRSPSMTLVQYLPDKTAVQIVDLPENESLPVGGGYGQYQLDAVQPLLAIDKKSPSAVKSIFSQVLKLPIDQVLVVDQSTQLTNKESLTQLMWDNRFWAWWKVVRAVQTENMQLRQVTSVSAVAGVLEPLTELQSDCPVAIVNATPRSGLASSVSTLLENGQASVVRTTDQAQYLPKTKLVVSQLGACPVIQRFVQNLLPGEVEFEVNQSITNQHRAEVVLYLGTDVSEVF